MYYYDPKNYHTLENAKNAMIRDIQESLKTAELMGRANTWTLPNWAIYQGDEIVLWADEVWREHLEVGA